MGWALAVKRVEGALHKLIVALLGLHFAVQRLHFALHRLNLALQSTSSNCVLRSD